MICQVVRIFFCCLASLILAADAYAYHPATHVLILNSYHQSMAWEQDVLQALQGKLELDRYHVEIHVENMDTKRVPDSAQYRQQLLALYRSKYAETPLRLIIASGNNAFNFMREFRAALFPGVPVVFCGVNIFEDGMLAELPGFTGVAEIFDAAATVNIALKIHPQTRQVFVINDYLPTGVAWTRSIRQQLAGFAGRLDIRYAGNLSMEELQAQLRALSADTIVLYGFYFHDRLDQYYPEEESIRLVSAASPVPVYGLLNFYLGYGMVGGNLISGYFQGETAAALANRILAGEAPDSIAVVKYGAKRNMFDYKQLQRWGISQSKLPPDSIIINKPSSFYEEYQKLVWGGVFGSVLGLTIVVLTMNIRRRKRAEQQLRQAQEALEQKVQEHTAQLNSAKVLAEETARRLERSMSEIEALVNNSPVGIIFMDEWRIIKRVNPEIAHITGYEPDELVGKTTVPFFLSRDDYEAFGKMIYPVLLQGETYEGDYLFVRKGGARSWCNIRCRLLHMDDISQGVIWIIMDINERVNAAQEKLMLVHHLEQAQRYKSLNVMAGAFAHHFNNIMMAVQGNLQLLQLQLPADAKAGHMVRQALKAAKKASNISGSMLAYVGQQELHRKPNDLAALVKNMEDLLRNNISSQVSLMVNHPAIPVWCNVDMRQIQEVVLNLVLNASEAIGKAAGQITISTGYSFEELEDLPTPFRESNLARGRYAFCRITDNGCGMDETTVAQIFDPFFTTRFTGRGLGLPVAVGIVKAHQGALTVVSSPGKGTTINLLLPALEMTAQQHSEQDLPTAVGLPCFSGIVLLADDDAMVSDTGRQMLEKIGFDVLVAGDGQEAVDIYKRNQEIIDLVILDVSMPAKDGVAAMQELQRLNAQVKVILASGYAEEQVMIGEGEVHPAAFIHKPFMLEELAETIGGILAGEGSGRGGSGGLRPRAGDLTVSWKR
ncbi:MAG: response regulator [Thermodesulfobacteriota bacterium]